MKSFRQASVLAVERLKALAISLEDKHMEEKKDLLKKCAMTTLNSKLVRGRGLGGGVGGSGRWGWDRELVRGRMQGWGPACGAGPGDR